MNTEILSNKLVSFEKEIQPSGKTKATPEQVLAAQLTQTKEIIIQQKAQLAQNAKIIADLQFELAKYEIETMQTENKTLRENYKFTDGLKFEKDKNDEWWIINSPT